MATIDDAVEFLTDPTMRMMGREEGGLVPMRAEVVSRLQQRGATEAEAWALIDDALEQLGGRHERRPIESTGLRRGKLMAREQVAHVLWVPAERVREH